MPEFLVDFNSKGGARDWQQKKSRNLLLADIFDMNLMPSVAAKVRGCGTFLEFRRYTDGKSQLTKGNFCKTKLCPLCNWRRSNKIFGQVSKIMNFLQQQFDYKFIFVTLTVRNCKDVHLKKTIDKMLNDFHNLVGRDSFQCFKGYIRVLEITYSKERDDYHPHLHCIFAVNKSYFTGRDYISAKKMMMIWRDVCNLDYDPIVNIKKVVNPETGEDSGKVLNGVVSEITKYAVKDSDYIEIYVDKEKKIRDMHRIRLVVDCLYSALNNVRLLGLGGCFKQAKEELCLGDAENGTLCDDDELRKDVKYVVERYQWRAGVNNYVLLDRNSDNLIEVVCDD